MGVTVAGREGATRCARGGRAPQFNRIFPAMRPTASPLFAVASTGTAF
jgi:hypothetical protein